MVDRSKVLVGLESCADRTGALCRTCPYDFVHNENCMGDMARDALELLKEQEPVTHAAWLCKETSTAYDLYGVKTWAAKYKCSKCGSVHRAIEAHMCYSYCPSCGAKMDEEIGAEEE